MTERDKKATKDHEPEDRLVENYRTILNELALLTTVSVLLFGFLLSSSGGFADSTLEESLYAVAIVLVATATLVFVLPVAYHHLQFPYHDFEKFTERTHGWTMFGIPLLGGSLYLSLSLAIWSLFNEFALAVAAVPLVLTFIIFLVRRKLSDGLS
jgi:hypothetical protein